VDPTEAPTGERAEYIERLRAELGTVHDAPDYALADVGEDDQETPPGEG
jgi:hypothetical protein